MVTGSITTECSRRHRFTHHWELVGKRQGGEFWQLRDVFQGHTVEGWDGKRL
jgi:hypothetical protein